MIAFYSPGEIQFNSRMIDIVPANVGGGLSTIVPLRSEGAAEDVAKLVQFLASDDSSYCTLTEFIIDAGMTVM
jgi:3alpha(or 20beta)-hydroxysteroid dehydrogenase